MTNIEEKIKDKCRERSCIIHDLDMDNIITQLDAIKKKYNKNYNDIVNECEIYGNNDIGALVKKTINPNIYPTSNNTATEIIVFFFDSVATYNISSIFFIFCFILSSLFTAQLV